MVRAILEGRKTQTRRVVKPQAWSYANDLQGLPWIYAKSGPNDFGDPTPIRCPYGQPGDRLWVREMWQYADWTEDGEPWLRYRADGATLLPGWAPDDWLDRLESVWATLSDPENIRIDGKAADRKWRASILMPRWASRIELEVTGVRVERVQGISEADAQAEAWRVLGRGKAAGVRCGGCDVGGEEEGSEHAERGGVGGGEGILTQMDADERGSDGGEGE
jgi:hypothetical protein